MAGKFHTIGDNNRLTGSNSPHPSMTGGYPADPTAQASTRTNTNTTAKTVSHNEVDKRVRLRPRAGAEAYVYGDATESGILSLLRVTNGMVFTSTPTISESHTVSYSQQKPAHSIAAFNSFGNTENVSLQVAGDFYVTNATEALYLLACIHFIRSVTKVDFGRNSTNPGTPPPVLLFSGYGSFMYNDIPVIVKSANFSFDQDVDYVEVPLDGNTPNFGKDISNLTTYFDVLRPTDSRVWVPSKITIALSLEQQPTPEWLTTKFNLNEFKKGNLLINGGLI